MKYILNPDKYPEIVSSIIKNFPLKLYEYKSGEESEDQKQANPWCQVTYRNKFRKGMGEPIYGYTPFSSLRRDNDVNSIECSYALLVSTFILPHWLQENQNILYVTPEKWHKFRNDYSKIEVSEKQKRMLDRDTPGFTGSLSIKIEWVQVAMACIQLYCDSVANNQTGEQPEMKLGNNQSLISLNSMYNVLGSDLVVDIEDTEEEKAERNTAKRNLGDSFHTIHVRGRSGIIARRVHGYLMRTQGGCVFHLFDKQKTLPCATNIVTSKLEAFRSQWRLAHRTAQENNFLISNVRVKLKFVSNFDKYIEICKRLIPNLSTLNVTRVKAAMDAGQPLKLLDEKEVHCIDGNLQSLILQAVGWGDPVVIPAQLITEIEVICDIEKKSMQMYVDKITTVIRPYMETEHKMELLGVCEDGTYITRQFLPLLKKYTVTRRLGYGMPITHLKGDVKILQHIIGFLDNKELDKLSKTFLKDVA